MNLCNSTAIDQIVKVIFRMNGYVLSIAYSRIAFECIGNHLRQTEIIVKGESRRMDVTLLVKSPRPISFLLTQNRMSREIG
ncbi:MAG: hypothetical protein MUC48_03990 [Leptolyngbya sp. Prado105]|nr:hypothetical protein [Leptolyngbya sp. Prado105]